MHNTPEQNADFRRAWDATNARWKAQNVRPVIVTAYTCEHVKTGERWEVEITPLDATFVGQAPDTFRANGGLVIDDARKLCTLLTQASKNHDGAYIYTVDT